MLVLTLNVISPDDGFGFKYGSRVEQNFGGPRKFSHLKIASMNSIDEHKTSQEQAGKIVSI